MATHITTVDGMSSTELSDHISERVSPSVSAAQDLYRHVNGHWLGTHEIPADRAVDGTFHQLRDQSEKDVRAIVEAQPKDSKIGALYSSFMDEAGIESAGMQGLEPDLAGVLNAENIGQLATALGALDRAGVGGVAGYYVAKDAGGNEERAYLVQTGLGLPNESYYREAQHQGTIAEYRTYVRDMLQLFLDAGVKLPGRFAELNSEEEVTGEHSAAVTAAEAIVRFETRLAKGHWDNVESRDAEKTYNPRTLADLPTAFPFAAWFEATGISEGTPAGSRVIVNQPSYLEHVAMLAEEESLDDWKLWATWKVLNSRAPMLPERFAKRRFDFYGRTLSGSTEQRARWKRGLGLVEGAIGELVGQKFVAEHFPSESKQKMLELVDYLIEAYRERITDLTWMTPATREKALVKLDKFTAKIGYPDKWRSFEGLEFQPGGENLLDNVRAESHFNHDFELSKLGKPTDPETWFATPQTVNAFYNPVMNNITFPAAILRPPFFDVDADAARNFGAISAVIGHEIGHGFDDQGSKFDGDGNLQSWWTEEDRAAFTELTNKLVKQFDGLVPTGLKQRGETGHKVNGEFTLGENIGDLGGLGIAIIALRRYLADQGLDFDTAPKMAVEGLVDSDGAADDQEYTALQRVFLQWARIWQTAIRPQMAAQYVSIDPHSPAEFRCNVVTSNIAEFYQAWDVKEGDGMWLPEDQRVTIW